MEIKIKPLLFAKSLGICELEAEGTLSRYKADGAPLNSIMWKPDKAGLTVALTEYSN
jgi:hypothetical protein